MVSLCHQPGCFGSSSRDVFCDIASQCAIGRSGECDFKVSNDPALPSQECVDSHLGRNVMRSTRISRGSVSCTLPRTASAVSCVIRCRDIVRSCVVSTRVVVINVKETRSGIETSSAVRVSMLFGVVASVMPLPRLFRQFFAWPMSSSSIALPHVPHETMQSAQALVVRC